MKQRGVGLPSGPDVVGEEVDATARQHPSWLRPGWDFEPRHVAWACADRDRQSVLGNLLNLVHKPLHLLQGWFRFK